jgi:hypothetical protein
MPAIEYGTYYWGVILQASGAQGVGETVHLHADQMRVDANGALIFTSAGRRPAGMIPGQENQDKKECDAKSAPQHSAQPNEKDAKEEKKDNEKGGAENSMTYVAFAPGTWKSVYAAKLQDGQPASIEHWTSFDGKQQLNEMVSVNSGAAGIP